MKQTALIVLALTGCCSPPPVESVVIRGTVTFAGALPKKRPIVTVDLPEIPPGSLQREDLVVDGKGNVRWAFVYIARGLEGRAFQPPASPILMEQKGFTYRPHVVGLLTGQMLELRNRDASRHCATTADTRGPPVFQEPHESRRVSFSKPQIMVKLRCDIHPWMNAWVGVLDHPFFAVTDAEGKFELKNLPPGNYRLAVWHETLAPEEREIDVRDNSTVNFTLKTR